MKPGPVGNPRSYAEAMASKFQRQSRGLYADARAAMEAWKGGETYNISYLQNRAAFAHSQSLFWLFRAMER